MNLLFITSNRLGDAILSMGPLAYLLTENPGADVTVVCGKLPAPLFRAVPGLKEIIVVEKTRYGMHWLGPFGRLLGRRWDLMVDLRRVGVMKLLPARRRIFGRDFKTSHHKLEELARIIGASEVPAPTIWLDSEAVMTGRRLLPDGAPILALAPTTAGQAKLWRPERYAAVAGALTANSGPMPGARIAVFAAPNEREKAQPVIDLLPSDRTVDLVGATDPLEAAATVARCQFFLGVDSGLMHLAAAMDVPTVGLFGEHGVPQLYRPWGQHTAYVHRRNPDWSMEDKPSAMDGITVDEVIRTCEALMERASVEG